MPTLSWVYADTHHVGALVGLIALIGCTFGGVLRTCYAIHGPWKEVSLIFLGLLGAVVFTAIGLPWAICMLPAAVMLAGIGAVIHFLTLGEGRATE